MEDIEKWKADQLALKRQCAQRKAEREVAAESKRIEDQVRKEAAAEIVAAEKKVRKEVREGQKGRGRGRPKGGALSVALFNEMMVDGRAHSAVKTLVEVATDPEHKHWASAQKILMDRLANVSHFQSENAHANPIVNITIGNAGPVDIEGETVGPES